MIKSKDKSLNSLINWKSVYSIWIKLLCGTIFFIISRYFYLFIFLNKTQALWDSTLYRNFNFCFALILYAAYIPFVLQFYTNKSLGKNISTDVIKDLLYRLILLLINNTFEKCTDASAYVRVINLQCVKIIERSDHTNIIW